MPTYFSDVQFKHTVCASNLRHDLTAKVSCVIPEQSDGSIMMSLSEELDTYINNFATSVFGI